MALCRKYRNAMYIQNRLFSQVARFMFTCEPHEQSKSFSCFRKIEVFQPLRKPGENAERACKGSLAACVPRCASRASALASESPFCKFCSNKQAGSSGRCQASKPRPGLLARPTSTIGRAPASVVCQMLTSVTGAEPYGGRGRLLSVGGVGEPCHCRSVRHGSDDECLGG
jgi:hypothetical protein